jgi:hypothetical protein
VPTTTLTWKGDLGDGEESNRLHPDTFEIPPAHERRNLPVGASAKLMFDPPEDAPPGLLAGGERMWVTVTERTEGGGYVGALDNHPVVFDNLTAGDPIAFGPEHVIDVVDQAEIADDGPDPYAVALAAVADQEGQPPALRRLVTLLDDAHLLARGLDEVFEALDQVADYEDSLDGLCSAWVLANETVKAAHRAVDELLCSTCVDKALGEAEATP